MLHKLNTNNWIEIVPRITLPGWSSGTVQRKSGRDASSLLSHGMVSETCQAKNDVRKMSMSFGL